MTLMPLRIAVGLVGVLACANSQGAASARQAETRASAPVEADTVGCEFAPTIGHPDGEALLREFVRRDAAGEFTRTSAWFASATSCPGHEPAPDAAVMARNPRLRVLARAPDSLRAEVLWDRLMIGDAKVPGLEVDTLIALRTPYGWRVRSPVLIPHVPPPPPPRESASAGAPAT